MSRERRRTRPRRRRAALLVGLVVAVALAVSAVLVLRAGGFGGTEEDEDGMVLEDVSEPSALVARPDGGFLYGERTTGRIWAVDAAGTRADDPEIELDVSAEGERGLLGIAVVDEDPDEDPRIFASWTDPDSRLLVGEIGSGGEVVVWEGPEVPTEFIGGRLDVAPDGVLLIGFGHMGEPTEIDDPESPNGKFLAIDIDGSSNQEADLYSTGWNHPVAFDFSQIGELWVADRAPEQGPERIARGEAGAPSDVTSLSASLVPTGLAVDISGDVLICSGAERAVYRFDLTDEGRVAEPEGPLDEECFGDIAILQGGRYVVATEDAIRMLPPFDEE